VVRGRRRLIAQRDSVTGGHATAEMAAPRICKGCGRVRLAAAPAKHAAGEQIEQLRAKETADSSNNPGSRRRQAYHPPDLQGGEPDYEPSAVRLHLLLASESAQTTPVEPTEATEGPVGTARKALGRSCGR
jgi:hypothetical protein